ncbi:hypothetical protein [Desulfobacter curvatus]|uniref:hypothetical protein n=1 Tax=Desulfobacter curvatus TaxID=2290 RepID=UPI0003823AA2|nr:hypothetical protein [Desulfobacter curvatus]
MIADIEIIQGANKIVGDGDRGAGFGRYQSSASKRKKDRRKRRYDRRKSVRDGVIVTLSFKNDRRKKPDRRFQTSVRPVPTDDAKGSGYDIIA